MYYMCLVLGTVIPWVSLPLCWQVVCLNDYYTCEVEAIQWPDLACNPQILHLIAATNNKPVVCKVHELSLWRLWCLCAMQIFLETDKHRDPDAYRSHLILTISLALSQCSYFWLTAQEATCPMHSSIMDGYKCQISYQELGRSLNCAIRYCNTSRRQKEEA